MVITTDDVERELQEEFARKAKKTKTPETAAWLPDFVPQRCLLLLGCGVLIALLFVLFPQLLWHESHVDSIAGQIIGASAMHEPVQTSSNNVAVQARTMDTESSTDQINSGPSAHDGKSEFISEAAPKSLRAPSEKTQGSAKGQVEWVVAIACIKGKSANCEKSCSDQGLAFDTKAMESLDSGGKVKSAAKAAGAVCANIVKIDVGGDWDGPHINSGDCTYTANPNWKPSRTLAPPCGFARLCACKKSGNLQGSGPKKLRTAQQMPLMWWDVAARVPKAIVGNWASETVFLDQVLRSFGKMQAGYKGPQKLLGFQPGKLFDEKGMFAFDNSIKSVAIDVGAATNPLPFDLPIDSSQVAFFVEPVQWKTIEESLAQSYAGVGNCAKNFDAGICGLDRALVFPAAVSHELGHATFHVTANPYCGSLEAFQTSKEIQNSKIAAVREIFDVCYKDAAKARKVATISLKAVIERIPKHITVKYIKIDAQGHDFVSLLSAGDQMSRIEYVRFEMQVDPPPGFKLVKDVPSYADVKAQLEAHGFKHEGSHACFFDHGASPFSKAVKEMECVFCRKLPCRENARPPLGPTPKGSDHAQAFRQPGPWIVPAGMDAGRA